MKTFFTVLISALLLSVASPSMEDTNYLGLSPLKYVERYVKAPLMITTHEERCLAEAIYYEAGSQSPKGKEAVALVVMNRVGSPHYSKTICGVISQSSSFEDGEKCSFLIWGCKTQIKKVCQFSFWCESRKKPGGPMWKESSAIARRVLQNFWKRDIINQYEEATYFHADYVKPRWKCHKVLLGKIDNHLFYREP